MKGRKIIKSDCLTWLAASDVGWANLVYIDPPFNTGKVQTRKLLRSIRVQEGEGNRGFGGHAFSHHEIARMSYCDKKADYRAWLFCCLQGAERLLADNGSLFVHLDARESHYAKIMLDEIFGADCFQNEIIWAYDYGGRSKRRWPAKHDVIFWYVKNPQDYTFHYDAIDRIAYMAPGLVGAEKAAKGKIPTDVWWNTIVATNGKEKTGYPSQKPLGILNRIVQVHSNRGDVLVDFFAGSGSLGEAAARNGRDAILVDNNPEAISVMRKRLAAYNFAICRGSLSRAG